MPLALQLLFLNGFVVSFEVVRELCTCDRLCIFFSPIFGAPFRSFVYGQVYASLFPT